MTSDSILALLKKYFTIAGGLWTCMEILTTLFPAVHAFRTIHENGLHYIGISVLLTIVWLIYAFHLKAQMGEKTICVRYGNILNSTKGSIVVGINEQGISDKNKINRESIHAQLMEKYGEDAIKKCIAEAHGKTLIKYQPESGNQDFVFLKMSDINEHGIATANTSQISRAVHDLYWRQEEYRISEHTLFVPLIGTGSAGVSPKKAVLDMTIREFVKFQRTRGETPDYINKLVIVIYMKDIFRLNPLVVAESLKNIPNLCDTCF